MTCKTSFSRVNSVPSVDNDGSTRRPGDESLAQRKQERQERQERQDRERKEVEAVMKQVHGL